MHWNLKVPEGVNHIPSLPQEVLSPIFTVGKWKWIMVLPVLHVNICSSLGMCMYIACILSPTIFKPLEGKNCSAQSIVARHSSLPFNFQIYMSEHLLLTEKREDSLYGRTSALSRVALGCWLCQRSRLCQFCWLLVLFFGFWHHLCGNTL